MMKKIVTALGNSILNDELKKYAKYDVLTEDIMYARFYNAKRNRCFNN